jgi:DNA polymerase III psi subunit
MEVTFSFIEVEMTRCQQLMHKYSDGADQMLSTSHLQVVGINVFSCFKENNNAQREQFWSQAL